MKDILKSYAQLFTLSICFLVLLGCKAQEVPIIPNTSPVVIGPNLPKDKIWITSKDGTQKLSATSAVKFPADLVIESDFSPLQTIDGFGFTLTQGSAEALSALSATQRSAFFKKAFVEDGISVLRISVGASDLSNSVYTYSPLSNDFTMEHFSFNGPDKQFLFPILNEILALKPDIKLLATPWTAPVWMKTNNSYVGGKLKPENYEVYGQYLVKYIQGMEKLGFKIWALTPQNEPENPNNEPSMLMTATEQVEFVNTALGPLFQKNNIKTKIIAFDHNCDHPEYPIYVLNNSSFVSGAAFHLYGGDIKAMSEVHDKTQKDVYFTEQFTSSKGDFGGDLAWHMQNVVIGSTNNWAKAVLEWNFATDEKFGPKTPGGCLECLGAVTVKSNGELIFNVSYYIIAQIAKFVSPGAVRIKLKQAGDIPQVVFKNPDGSIAVLVLNNSNSTRKIRFSTQSPDYSYQLRAGEVGTIFIPASK
jgi:glucosylceramidase